MLAAALLASCASIAPSDTPPPPDAAAPGVARDAPPPPPPRLELDIPDERIFLVEHRLELRMSEPAGSCAYVVTYDGTAADQGTVTFAGEPPGTWLTVRWRPPAEEAVVLRLRLDCRDQAGGQAVLELYPWWLEIPHEDVVFPLGSAEIGKRERPKLDQAFREIAQAIERYGKVLNIRLYVAGHTDTVGDAQRNRTLAEARARSLALALRQLGVTIPIWYAGFGEAHLAVPTADEVDEPRNRRARYILAVNDPEEGEWHEL